MKNLLRFIFSFVVVIIAQNVFADGAGHLFLGANWMVPNKQYLPCDSTIKVYHTGFNYHSDTAWFHGLSSSSRLLFMDDTVIKYSTAQMMMYQAAPKIGSFDPLHFYFANHDTGTGDTVTIGTAGNVYWEIDSGAHYDDTVMWNNEYSGSWWQLRANPGPLKLVVKLRIAKLPLFTDPNKNQPVISIVLKEHTQVLRTTDSTKVKVDSTLILGTFDILWSSFDTIGDTVMFMPGSISLPFDLPGRSDAQLGGKGIELEVHSPRYVTNFIQWVCVEDLAADALLGGVHSPGLDYTNSAKAAISKTVRDTIAAECARAEAKLGAKLMRYYIADEPSRSCFAAMGYLSDSVVARGVVTEFQGDWSADQKQFIEQAHPDVYWRFGGGVGGSVCGYVNTGLDGMFIIPLRHGAPQTTLDSDTCPTIRSGIMQRNSR